MNTYMMPFVLAVIAGLSLVIYGMKTLSVLEGSEGTLMRTLLPKQERSGRICVMLGAILLLLGISPLVIGFMLYVIRLSEHIVHN